MGNFLCVDEDPASAVSSNIAYASMVHIKDFYIRPADRSLSEGWFRSSHGTLLRGAIVGHGDIDMTRVLRIIKQSGYNGYMSVEFEGMEPGNAACPAPIESDVGCGMNSKIGVIVDSFCQGVRETGQSQMRLSGWIGSLFHFPIL